MLNAVVKPGFVIRHLADVPAVPCPCGASTRLVTGLDLVGCSFHVTEIRDSVRHYHRRSAEVYYILEGCGTIELDDERHPVQPGTVVVIRPGTRHRLEAPEGVKTVVVAVPPFSDSDEYFD